MRVMVKFRFPVDPGNEVVRTGKVGKVFQQLMDDLKPEAAYFFPEGGQRAGLLIFDMQDSSQVALVGERFWFGLQADVEMTPVMSAEDLQKGIAGVEEIVKNYS
jgi:hypothetical protein